MQTLATIGSNGDGKASKMQFFIALKYMLQKQQKNGKQYGQQGYRPRGYS